MAATSSIIPRKQAVFGLIFLLCMMGAVAAFDGMARSPRIAAWLYQQELNFAVKTSSQIHDTGYFIDSEDRLLTEQLPQADYSHGGIYIFGTSTAKVDFPGNSPIRDYATANTSHADSDKFLRYLIERRGFLSAGPEKTHVIYALSYHDARQDPTGFFAKLWNRHGLYQFDTTSGVTEIPVNPLQRFVAVERTRISGFIDALGLLAVEQMHLLANAHGEPPKKHYIDYYRKADAKYMGPDWEQNMTNQVAAFARRVDDLQRRGTPVDVVLLPAGSWENNMPYKQKYFTLITLLCTQKHVPMHDWSALLPDDEFDDAMHPDAVGMAKVRTAFDRLAATFPNAPEVQSGSSINK